MLTLRSSTRLFASLALVFVSVGCGPNAEKACAKYMELRKTDKLPVDASVEKACVAELTKLKSSSPAQFECFAGRLLDVSRDTASADGSELFCGGDNSEAKRKAAFPIGLFADASGAWANEKGDLTTEQCNEAAKYIAGAKVRIGLFKDFEVKDKQSAFAKECDEHKKDPGAAETVRCLRKAKEMKDFMACNDVGVRASGGRTQVDIIEGCVSKCQASHPGGATPEYMECFNGCKAAGGP